VRSLWAAARSSGIAADRADPAHRQGWRCPAILALLQAKRAAKTAGVLPVSCGSLLSDGVLRTDDVAVAAAQTVPLIDANRGMRHIDAGLRTDLGTASAAVTGSGDEIAAVRLRTGAKREGGALDRPSGQIEPLTASLIQLKD